MSKKFKLDCADPEIRESLYKGCKENAKTDLDNKLCELIPFADDCNLPDINIEPSKFAGYPDITPISVKSKEKKFPEIKPHVGRPATRGLKAGSLSATASGIKRRKKTGLQFPPITPEMSSMAYKKED